MKIIIIGALPESLVNFRGHMIRALIEQGHEVIAMSDHCDESSIVERIHALGCHYQPYPVSRNGLNPIADITTLHYLARFFRQQQPDIVISYTIKPVIWGGIAARFFAKNNIRFYGLVEGLGYVFQPAGFKRKILASVVARLYKMALNKASGVIFLNPDNQQAFIEKNIVKKALTHRIYGCGVDISHYEPQALDNKPATFLTIARLLADKGLREFAQAAKEVKKQYPEATFQLLGPTDPSPNGIPVEEVQRWHDEGIVNYLGCTDDVRPYINDSHIFVLASYHEGVPRTSLEAMSIGRPVLTTLAAGCKETVEEGINGFLVPIGDADQLAERMIWFIEHREQWQGMADQSRALVEQYFDVNKVNQHIFSILKLNRT